MPRLAPNGSLATELIEDASSARLLAGFDPASGNLPPERVSWPSRRGSPSMKVNPVSGFAAGQLPYTTYRPGLPAYVQVSNVIAELTGEISSGSMTAKQAAASYASQVTRIVGCGQRRASEQVNRSMTGTLSEVPRRRRVSRVAQTVETPARRRFTGLAMVAPMTLVVLVFWAGPRSGPSPCPSPT